MSFQSTSYQLAGFGVPGELYRNSPFSAEALTINSVNPANNIIGSTVATWQPSQGENYVAAGKGADNSSAFAGFLASPKSLALYSGTFSPSLTVANNTQVTIVEMGVMIVTFSVAANIGDWVIYNTTTGQISPLAQGEDLPVGSAFAQAIVTDYSTDGSGLAVIRINPTFTIPQLA